MGFVPIDMEAFVRMHLKANPGDRAEEIRKRLKAALAAHCSGARFHCGNPLWIIGSAVNSYACFTCITGESVPSGDFEIAEACV
uniref:Uncharacterized protein n=1 Tax=Solibacter usitatus (strain Ellin6076) TaxID=234267 RepID=Q01NH1_SOLUE